MAAERAGMRARLPRTAASSARVHQWVDRFPSSFTSHGTQPSFPVEPENNGIKAVSLQDARGALSFCKMEHTCDQCLHPQEHTVEYSLK